MKKPITADEAMKKMLLEIGMFGTSTENQKVRPVWADTNEPAYTLKTFGVTNCYDLRNGFPAGTLRPVPFKNCIQELLWIWQKKSNKIEDLGLHIWDQWQDEDGTIGRAYGYQIGKKTQSVRINSKDELDGLSIEVDEDIKPGTRIPLDQTDYIIHQLKHNPFSRRIIANMYNIDELDQMNLHPCAYSITLNVTEEDGQKVLNMILNQRSLDIIVAGYWNVCQYAVLLALLAHCTGMVAGKLLHVIADAHVYNRHLEIAEVISNRESFEEPTLWINPDKTNFYDITLDDIKLENYNHNEQIKNIPVAK